MFRGKSVNILFEKVNARTIMQELGIGNKPFLVFYTPTKDTIAFVNY